MVPSEDGAVFDTVGAWDGGSAGVGTWKLWKAEGTESAGLTQKRGYKTNRLSMILMKRKVVTMEEEKLVSDPARRARPVTIGKKEPGTQDSLNPALSQYKGENEMIQIFLVKRLLPAPKLGVKSPMLRLIDERIRSNSFRSLKEIGCSDEILGTSSSFWFPQPLHIQIETCRKVENVLARLDRKASHDKGLVNHVVLFDYPHDPSEYVRSVGRTARGASGNSKAFVFTVGKQVSLARRVMERNLKGHQLHDVPCF
ncbi:hypothetical protein ACQ4PT_055740 [Festuca glaucescens]